MRKRDNVMRLEDAATIVTRIARLANDRSAPFSERRAAIQQLGTIANDATYPGSARKHAAAAVEVIAERGGWK